MGKYFVEPPFAAVIAAGTYCLQKLIVLFKIAKYQPVSIDIIFATDSYWISVWTLTGPIIWFDLNHSIVALIACLGLCCCNVNFHCGI